MAFSGLKRIVAGLALAGALAVSGAQAADKVVVASKIDTEGAVLGNIIVLLLEQAGVPVENKVSLGVTKIVRGALIAGEIDIYPEYTGNAGFFFNVPADPAWSDFDAGYRRAAELDLAANKLVWLTPAPANNTWVIAVRSEIATEAKLVSLEDFGKWVSGGAKVKLAGSAEFVESPAALPAFQKAYGFTLTNDQLLVLSGGDTAATIKAAAEQTSGVNAAMAYGTDGALAALGLTALTDPKGVQPVYAPAPVVRAETLARFPAIATALEPAFKTLTLETLQKLNAAVALDGIDAKTVAKDYLTKAGLLK
jgi:osmoprotectant transport system substrate-binding protein